GLGRFLKLVDRGDAELLVDRAGGRGPHTRHAQQRDESRRHRGQKVGVTLRLAGLDEMRDRLGHRRPGLRDLAEPPLLEERRDRLTQIADRSRHLPVGDRAEDVLALQLDEIPYLIKHVGDGLIVKSDCVARHDSMLWRLRTRTARRPSAAHANHAALRHCAAPARARSFLAYSAAIAERSGRSSTSESNSIDFLYARSLAGCAPSAS